MPPTTKRKLDLAVVHKAGEQSAGDAFEFVMATEEPDRVGDVIELAGIELAAFRKNPIALFDHRSTLIVGTWENVRIEGKKLVGRLKLAAAGTSRIVDELRSLIEQRILRAVSVGFQPLDGEAIPKTSGIRFTRSALMECSLVAVPMNSNALRIKGADLSPEGRRLFFSPARPIAKALPSVARDRPGNIQPGQPAPQTSKGLGIMAGIPDKIAEHQARLNEVDDEIETITKAAENDNDRDFSEDETTTLEHLTGERVGLIKSLDSLTAIEAGRALKAKAAGGAGGNGALVLPRFEIKEKPGWLLAKMATVAILAWDGNKTDDQIIAERYGEDRRIKGALDYIRKSAVGIADMTTDGWAKQLVRHDIQGFLEDLIPVSAWAKLADMGLGIQFDGAGSVTIPNRDPSVSMAGAFVGEAGVIPVVNGKLGSAKLEPYKLAAISPFTKELARASTPQIEGVIRDGLRDDTSRTLDKYLFDAIAPVPGVRPAGVLNGVTVTASAGVTPAAIVTDIKTIVGKIIAAGGGKNIVLFMNAIHILGLSTVTTANGDFLFRDEIARGTILGYPLVASTTLVPGVVIGVDAGYFASAFDVPEFDVSESATLTMANADNAAPTQATLDGTVITPQQVPPDGGIHVGGGATGPATAGAVAMSMFQQWAVAVRMVMPVSWAMMRAGMVQAVNGVAW